MAAVPKQKRSKSATRSKRAEWQKTKQSNFPKVVLCSHCGASKMPHRVCKSCGYYRGKQYIEPKTRVSRVSART